MKITFVSLLVQYTGGWDTIVLIQKGINAATAMLVGYNNDYNVRDHLYREVLLLPYTGGWDTILLIQKGSMLLLLCWSDTIMMIT